MRFDAKFHAPIKRAIEAAEAAHMTPVLIRLTRAYERGLVGEGNQAGCVCGLGCDPTTDASHIQCAPQRGEETAAKLYLTSFMEQPKNEAKTPENGAKS